MSVTMTYNGTASTTYPNLICRPHIDLLPVKRENTVSMIGKDGTFDFENNSYKTRRITVLCTLTDTTFANLQAELMLISVWLSGSGTLIFSTQPTIQWNAKTYLDIGINDVSGTVAQFKVVFKCQPYAEDVTATEGIIDSAQSYGSGVRFYPAITATMYDLVNSIANGNFVNTDNWSADNGSLGVSSNILSGTGNGVYLGLYIIADAVSGAIGDVIYMRTKARVTNSSATELNLFLEDTVRSVIDDTVLTPTINEWYTLSANVTLGTANDYQILIETLYVDAATESGKVTQAQTVFKFNLTTIFGAGNEPSAATFDTYLDNYLTAQSVDWFEDSPSTAMQISLLSSGEYVLATDTFASKDVLVYDMATGKVTRNDIAIMDKVSIDSLFFDVPIGSQTITGLSDGFYVASISYRKGYLYA